MAGYTGLRSCTWTEFPVDILTNSSLISRSTVSSNCDLTLLTCLLIGSYRFCIVPLLAVFNGKGGNRLWRSKHRWNLNMNAWRGSTLCFQNLDLFINRMSPNAPYCFKSLQCEHLWKSIPFSLFFLSSNVKFVLVKWIEIFLLTHLSCEVTGSN